jgi:hypothetical protein
LSRLQHQLSLWRQRLDLANGFGISSLCHPAASFCTVSFGISFRFGVNGWLAEQRLRNRRFALASGLTGSCSNVIHLAEQQLRHQLSLCVSG